MNIKTGHGKKGMFQVEKHASRQGSKEQEADWWTGLIKKIQSFVAYKRYPELTNTSIKYRMEKIV
jgi:hypothetical protein